MKGCIERGVFEVTWPEIKSRLRLTLSLILSMLRWVIDFPFKCLVSSSANPPSDPPSPVQYPFSVFLVNHLLHSIHVYLLSTYCVQGTVLYNSKTSVNQQSTLELPFYGWSTVNT